MKFRQQRERHNCTDRGIEHIALRIPYIALRAEECLRRFAGADRHAPLEELVHGAEGEADADDQEIAPAGRGDDLFADEELADDQCRDESLGEMTHFIVIVPRLSERIADPVEERHFRVGVMTAHRKDGGVDDDERIGKIGEREAIVGSGENNETDQCRKDLQEPGELVFWINGRDSKNCKKYY